VNKGLSEHIGKCIPSKYLNKGREMELQEWIERAQEKRKGYSAQEARLSYLGLAISWESCDQPQTHSLVQSHRCALIHNAVRSLDLSLLH
jgi:hypothetical protein